MKFYLQNNKKTCQVVAIRTVLTHFGVFISEKEIKQNLPKHSFGNLITEVGSFLLKFDITVKLIYNNANIKAHNKLYWETLEEFQRLGGKFSERKFVRSDFDSTPSIINVNYYSLQKSTTIERSPHYIVYYDGYIYDGSNFSKKVKRDYKFISLACENINDSSQNGSALILS